MENGRYLVRAANTGITAVVDPRGRVLERTSLFEPAALVRDVPFVSGTTFYTRHGDVFAWTLRRALRRGAPCLVRRPACRRPPLTMSTEASLSDDLQQQFEDLVARAADIRGYL